MFRILSTTLAILARYDLRSWTGGLSASDGGQGGQYQPPSQPPRQEQSGGSSGKSTLAIVTLICGVAAWIIFPLAAYVGIVTGWMELKNIERGESDQSNKGLTQIGFWASVVNVVVQFLGGCLFALFFLGIFGAIGAGAAASN